MIIWRGWGIAVPVLTLLALVAAEQVAALLFGPGAYQRNVAAYAGPALLVVGALLHLLDRRTRPAAGGGDAREPSTATADAPATAPAPPRRRHDLFFVPLRVWAVLALAGGLVISVVGLVAAAS